MYITLHYIHLTLIDELLELVYHGCGTVMYISLHYITLDYITYTLP